MSEYRGIVLCSAEEFKLAEICRQLETAANEVLRVYMPQFNDSRAVDECLVALALAVSGGSNP